MLVNFPKYELIDMFTLNGSFKAINFNQVFPVQHLLLAISHKFQLTSRLKITDNDTIGLAPRPVVTTSIKRS